MAAIRLPVAALPEDGQIEVWGDNTVWLVHDSGKTRLRLLDWAADMKERQQCP